MAIQDTTCRLKYIYSAYPIDIRMFTHWFNKTKKEFKITIYPFISNNGYIMA